MAGVPRQPLVVSSDPVRIGYAPSAGHWYTIARTLNWLHGDGGCCLPWCTVDWTILTSTSETYPVALRSRPATTHRLWMVYAAGGTGNVTEAEFTDLSAATHTFQATTLTDPGRHLFYFVEDCSAQDADMGVQTGTIGFEQIAGGTLRVHGIACYDLPRPSLDESYPDMGVEPPGGASPMVDRDGESAGGIAESVGYARRHAARLGLFTWLGDEADPETVASGNSLFDISPLVMPRRVGDSTSTGITAHVRARLASGGSSATLRFDTDNAGDDDSTSVSSTSWAWYTLGPINATNEDSADNVDLGARTSAPFGELFNIDNQTGDDLEIAAVIVTESPAAALDHWTPQRLGEDDVELWLDAEHLCTVAGGDVTAWACPITGRAATLSGAPSFDGPDSGYGNRSVVDFDDSIPEHLAFADGSQWDPTGDGLTVYWVGEWSSTASAYEYLFGAGDIANKGWGVIEDGSGLRGFAIDGGGTVRYATEGTTAPGGAAIIRFRMDGDNGTIEAGIRVNRGSEATVSFTNYSASAGTHDLQFFRNTAGDKYGSGKVGAFLVVNREVSTAEDERIMTALESRFGL